MKKNKKNITILIAAIVLPGGFVVLGTVYAWKIFSKIKRTKSKGVEEC